MPVGRRVLDAALAKPDCGFAVLIQLHVTKKEIIKKKTRNAV